MTLHRSLVALAKGTADLLWPPRCVACDFPIPATPDVPFCPTCADTLLDCYPREQRPSFVRPAQFTAAAARFEFGGQLAVALRRAKYGGEARLSRQLGFLLRPLPSGFDLIVPVP